MGERRAVIATRNTADHRAIVQGRRDAAIRKLAEDGAVLAASIVLTPAYEYLTPRQHVFIASINKRARRLL